MEVWGVTGLMGSGKSAALSLLQAEGCAVIDSDQVAREVVMQSSPEGSATLKKLEELFGSQVLLPTGELDRSALRAMLQGDVHNQKKLEAVLHPLILERMKVWLKEREVEGCTRVFIEGTRLVESGFSAGLTGCVFVEAPDPDRWRRIQTRGGMSLESAQALAALQDEGAMRRVCTEIWVNDGDLEHLRKQIQSFLRRS